MKIRGHQVDARTILVHVIAWGVAVAWIIPFVGVLMTATRPFSEVAAGWWDFTPLTLSLQNFVDAFFHPSFPIWRGYVNTAIVAVPATLIPLLVAAMAGYGFSRFSFPIRNYIFLFVVLLMAVPQQMVVIPLFQTMDSVGLIDNHLSLILLHSAWALPWMILFMRNFFGSLPPEIEEAARVDGATDFQVFFRIVLPMAIPAFASAMVLQFMWVWNDFFFALIFMLSSEKLLATQLVPLIGRRQFGTDWGLLTAGSVLVMLIPLIVYGLLQRFYIRGMIGWTVRG